MSSVITVSAGVDSSVRPTYRQRRATRRRLRRVDALSARLAELRAIEVLLDRAVPVVSGGWVQGAWFAVDAPPGERLVTAFDVRRAVDQQVTGACLVGAVVHAAGGPAVVRSQLVQRTLDLMWHALRDGPDQPVRWCPGPGVRLMSLLELTRWNDDPHRTKGEVVGLLHDAREAAGVQRDLCLAERGALTVLGASAAT